jgi:hypothetical protein
VQPQRLLFLQAFLFILVGLAFTLYSPLIITGLNLTGQSQDALGYWQMVSFARLFGAALCGWGMTLLIVQRILSNLKQAAVIPERQLHRAMLLANLLVAFVSATQAASIWGTGRSWWLFLFFLILAILSGISTFVVSKSN